MHIIRSTLLATAICAPAWSAAATVSADTWPQYRGANRDGISTEKLIFGSEAPIVVWKAKLGTGYTSMAISNGLVYASGNTNDQDTLFCLDAKTGKPAWSFSYAQKLDPNSYDGGPNATPTVAGKNVFLLAKDGFAACVDAKSGKVVWQKNVAQEVGAQKPQWGFSGSPTVVGRALFLNIGSHGTALEAASGKLIWKSGGDASGYASVIPFTAGKENNLLVFTKDALAGVDATSGKKLWSYPWTTMYGVNAADPIVQGSQVFLSSSYNYGCGVVDISGQPKEVWKSPNMKNHFNACVLLDGNLYGFDDGTLRCLDWKTGAPKWEKGGLGKGSLAACSGKLVILSDSGELVIADAVPTAFKEISRTQVLSGKNLWTSPAIAEGQIYCRNPKGDLVCLAVK
ncbi:MAG TPA: PQQ-binding-like beta-propeller repeat protein [Planctomycetota bacterium]|nr:PQQ-binding-like beta-propeller repeat protein [Planctomycetota bacterium]